MSGFWYLFLAIIASLSFLKVVLNGLKHETSRGWSGCEVCEGKVIMSKPKAIACSTSYSVTCDSWPSIINKWRLVWESPLRTESLKNERNFLKRKLVIHAFVCIAIHVFLVCIVWCNRHIIFLLWICKTSVKLTQHHW